MNNLEVLAKIVPEANGLFRLQIWGITAKQGQPTKDLQAEHKGFFTVAEARVFAQREYGLRKDQIGS